MCWLTEHCFGPPSADEGDVSLWHGRGRERSFGWRLASLGVVSRRHVYGGEDADGPAVGFAVRAPYVRWQKQ